MRITEIIRDQKLIPEGDPIRFRVGEPVVEGGHIVTKIVHHKDGYNKGRQGAFSCYAVHFEGLDSRRIIAVSTVVDMEVSLEGAEPKSTIEAQAVATEAQIELPEE